MSRLITWLLLCAIWSAAPAAADQPRPWKGSPADAFAEAATSHRLILVDLYADWCGWCKRLEEEVFSTPQFQDYAADFVLLRVDTEDGDEGSKLQETYGVFSLPTTLVLDSRGVRVGEIRGFAPADAYIQRIEQELASHRGLEEDFRRFGQSTDDQVLSVLAEEFHRRRDGDRAAELYRRILSGGRISPAEIAWVGYQLADSLRLSGRFDEALDEARGVRARLSETDPQELRERLDLLLAEIELDRGNCRLARAALLEFLDRHPRSDLRRFARRALASLETERFQCT